MRLARRIILLLLGMALLSSLIQSCALPRVRRNGTRRPPFELAKVRKYSPTIAVYK